MEVDLLVGTGLAAGVIDVLAAQTQGQGVGVQFRVQMQGLSIQIDRIGTRGVEPIPLNGDVGIVGSRAGDT